MKHFILLLAVVSCIFGQSKTKAETGSSISSQGGSCSLETKSTTGHIIWPWSLAKPFPWTTIQGIWAIPNGINENLFFAFKVTRSTKNVKQLTVEMYDALDCRKPIGRGIGLVNSGEKNTIRVNMNNVLLKIALFNTDDTVLPSSCGTRVLAATFYKIDKVDPRKGKSPAETTSVLPVEPTISDNAVLRKVSNYTTFACDSN